MILSKTDTEKLIKLLTKGAFLINTNCVKPCDQDKGRQMMQFVHKIKKRDGKINR